MAKILTWFHQIFDTDNASHFCCIEQILTITDKSAFQPMTASSSYTMLITTSGHDFNYDSNMHGEQNQAVGKFLFE